MLLVTLNLLMVTTVILTPLVLLVERNRTCLVTG